MKKRINLISTFLLFGVIVYAQKSVCELDLQKSITAARSIKTPNKGSYHLFKSNQRVEYHSTIHSTIDIDIVQYISSDFVFYSNGVMDVFIKDGLAYVADKTAKTIIIKEAPSQETMRNRSILQTSMVDSVMKKNSIKTCRTTGNGRLMELNIEQKALRDKGIIAATYDMSSSGQILEMAITYSEISPVYKSIIRYEPNILNKKYSSQFVRNLEIVRNNKPTEKYSNYTIEFQS